MAEPVLVEKTSLDAAYHIGDFAVGKPIIANSFVGVDSAVPAANINTDGTGSILAYVDIENPVTIGAVVYATGIGHMYAGEGVVFPLHMHYGYMGV